MRCSVGCSLFVVAAFVALACDPVLELFSRGEESEGMGSPDERPAAPPVHIDSFDGAVTSWTPHARANVTGGVMAVSSGVTPMNTWLPHRIANGAFGVTASWGGGDPSRTYGLIFRQADGANAYYFMITRAGAFSLTYLKQGQFVAAGDWGSDPTAITGVNDRIEVDFSGYAVECSVNGKVLAHAYLDTIFAGQVGLFASQEVAVSFDDATLFDHDVDPDVEGAVTSAGRPVPGANVRLVLVEDAATMEGRLIDSRMADASGRYSFHLSREGIYLIEAGVSQEEYAAGKGAYGARFVDSLSADKPAARSISLVTIQGGER